MSWSSETISLTGVDSLPPPFSSRSASAVSLRVAARMRRVSSSIFGTLTASTIRALRVRSMDSIRWMFRSRACSAFRILS
ncbi:hypothetical protein U876_09030 [Aeromonas hydrophila NJ-35]|nr:hypothetical protein U876_09030 [Aeromonas hydrophila NJ-35]